MEDFHCTSPAEALALAEKLKAQGRYKYFRGQRNAKWELVSSFFRLSESERAKALERIKRFFSWIMEAKELLPYILDDDQRLAIAQHYGLPTPLIDFTTEPSVAAFFATDGAVLGDQGCIMMVDPVDFNDIVGAFNDGRRYNLHFLEVDVANLWRLQAQHGLFLEAQVPLTQIYPPDRILFPQDCVPIAIDRGQIYPHQKSHLELQLDHYFTIERAERAREQLTYALDIHIEEEPLPQKQRDFLGLQPQIDHSPPIDERWPAAASMASLPVVSHADLLSTAESTLQTIHARRNEFELLIVEPDEVVHGLSSSNAVKAFWEGARLEPYSSTQIAAGLAQTFHIRNAARERSLSDGKWLRELGALLYGESIEVEFAIVGGAYSRAFVGVRDLVRSMSKEALDFLQIDEDVASGKLGHLLAANNRIAPKFFSSEPFRDLFVRQFLPWQVACRRPMIIFAPSHLERFGVP